MRICVYCASSNLSDPIYRDAAFELGALIAQAGHTLVFGGGAAGSMGAVADGALSAGGQVHGIMPHFMDELEWGHPGITQLDLVDTMRERKHLLLNTSDAVVALPGGVGTFEEVFEAISLKRLGIYLGPIIFLDTKAFYAPLDAFLTHVIDEHFLNPEHAQMWQRVARPADVLPAIAAAPVWSSDARRFAVSHK